MIIRKKSGCPFTREVLNEDGSKDYEFYFSRSRHWKNGPSVTSFVMVDGVRHDTNYANLSDMIAVAKIGGLKP